MLQQLPFEIITSIADHLPEKDIQQLALSCRQCYSALLPQLWHNLTLSSVDELSDIAKRLEKNKQWTQRATHFVREFSFTDEDESEKKQSPSFIASMFGIAADTESRNRRRKQLEEARRGVRVRTRERMAVFGRRLLDMFPRLSNLVIDFKEASKNFSDGDHDQEEGGGAATAENNKLPFSGSLSLINYKADNTQKMHDLIAPFKETHQLKVSASPVLSLCEDFDESILTDADIRDLASLGLKHLTRLELSYLDSDVDIDTISTLLNSMPNLTELYLKWIFPPKKENYQQLCQCIETHASLYPERVDSKPNILQVQFLHNNNNPVTV
ncbi:hypothetical protein K501DRAFT_335359 [Backusella circina FSU 941]|nr:hypothetical protein K501DRAFT_335359 [Backusella circina FSU 941]